MYIGKSDSAVAPMLQCVGAGEKLYKMLSILVCLTILSGTLGQLAKVPLGSGNLYPLDILVIGSVIIWFLGKLIKRDYEFKIPGYFILLFFFLFWAFLTLVRGYADVSFSEFLTGLSYLVRFIFYSLFGLLVYDLDSKSADGLFRKRLVRALMLSAVIVGLAGFVQLFTYPDLSALAAEFGYDPHKNRLVSTFLDPNFAAAYLVLGLALLFNRGIKPSNPSTTSLYSIVVGGILLMALLLTFSRSGWLMFAAVLLLYGLLRSPKLLILAALAGFLAYFAVPRIQTRISGITDPDDSAKLRLVSWSRALEIFREYQIMGVGYNLYRPAQERFGFFDYRDFSGGRAGAGSDSSLLLVLATTGVPGLLTFLFAFVSVFVIAIKRLNSPAGLALTLSLFGLLVDSQFINSLFFPQIMLWVWALTGLNSPDN